MPVKVKKRWWIFAIGLIVVIVGAVLIGLPLKQPAYQSKPIGAWLREITTSPSVEVDTNASSAFRSMGVDAVPFIVADLRRYDSFRYRLYARLFPKLPAILQRRLSPPFQPQFDFFDRLERGHSAALSAIGPGVESYLPNLLNDRNVHVRRAGAECLMKFPRDENVAYQLMSQTVDDGDPGVRLYAVSAARRLNKRAVPLLVRALEGDDSGGTTNRIFYVRANAASRLGELGQDARAAVPRLSKLVRDTKAQPKASAAPLLGAPGAPSGMSQMIQQDNEATGVEATIALLKIERRLETVGMLVEELTNTANEYVMYRIVDALGEFGPGAKEATPVLTEIYQKHNPATGRDDQWRLRQKSSDALKKIDPAAAARAGAK